MNLRALVPTVPAGAWAWAAFYLLISIVVWAFFLKGEFSADWVQWGFAVLVGALFVAFAFSFWALLTLVPSLRRPTWLNRPKALTLSLFCFALQSGLAGALTMMGAWPHPKLWFLGALPFLWIH